MGGDRNALDLGCATSNVFARELMEKTHFEGTENDMACDEATAQLCWMTCMNYEEKNVSVETCESQSAEHNVVCANEDGELWSKEIHKHNPAFSLRCLSTEEIKMPSMDMDMDGMDHDHGGMDHDHNGMDHSAMAMDESSAAGLFVVIPALLGMMLVAMV